MFWLLLVVAGNETTRNAVSGSVRRAARARAVDLARRATWTRSRTRSRSCSVTSPPCTSSAGPRRATSVLGDQEVRAGDKVVIWFSAANRDPAVFRIRTDSTCAGSEPARRVRDRPALLPRRPPRPPRDDRDAALLLERAPDLDRRRADPHRDQLHQRDRAPARAPRAAAQPRSGAMTSSPNSASVSGGAKSQNHV